MPWNRWPPSRGARTKIGVDAQNCQERSIYTAFAETNSAAVKTREALAKAKTFDELGQGDEADVESSAR